LRHYEQVGSTNDLVREHARNGEPEGLVILAEEQTTGRGRRGRGWIAPPRTSLLLSLLLRPTWLAPADAFYLTMMTGVALCEVIEAMAPVRAALKWPNDLLLPVPGETPPALRKAAGILSEVEFSGERLVYVVVGMGINVNWAPQGIVDGRDLSAGATSVSIAVGHVIDRIALLQALMIKLDQHYAALRSGRREALFTAWRDRLAMLGQVIEVRLADSVLRGVAEDVSPSGALLLRDEHGAIREILSGEVGG
jgi:BirA family biotin operon repressor/biotin-[acetyl-CoA-carboxylase] ligase